MENFEIICRGKSIAKQFNVAICSVVRDCDKSLLNNIPVIETIRSNFKSSVVIVFENDSKDRTKQILNK